MLEAKFRMYLIRAYTERGREENCSTKGTLQLQSSSVIFKPYPFLFFPSSSPRLNPKKRFQSHSSTRFRRVLATSNTAVDSSNGAVIASDSEDPSSSYGRQYFPLAAVVGRVSFISFSLSFVIYGRKGNALVVVQKWVGHFVNEVISRGFSEDAIKTALLLGAIDREIGGIAISGRRGTAKTVKARGLHAILPPIDVVVGSIANADPACPEEWEDGLAQQAEYDSYGNVKTQVVRSPFVQIPLGVTEDRLIGSVDVEESVKTGTTVFQPGLLAEAHRGVLYVDEINLLDEGISNLLLNVLTEGVNTVEREGISFKHPCKPLFIATYNPEEGAVREHLLDGVAINLSADLPMNFEDRVAAVGIAAQFQEASNEVFKMVEEETEYAKTQIILAREYLKDVTISQEQLKYLVMEALRGGCQLMRNQHPTCLETD
ncbi:hypothetical protein CRYUN_Cryun11dG0082200 [Craigia yunnanensis]